MQVSTTEAHAKARCPRYLSQRLLAKNSFRDSFDGAIVRGASATSRLKTTAISRE